MKRGRLIVVAGQTAAAMSRRRFLASTAAGAIALGTGIPARPGWANAQPVYRSGDLEALVVSDGHFVLPTGFLVTPEAPLAEREAVLKATGQGGEQIQLVNNVTVIRKQSEVILVDAGTGPRHQPTAGKLAENLRAAGIQPAAVTKGCIDPRPSRSSLGRPPRKR
jgi:hypothetical protein